MEHDDELVMKYLLYGIDYTDAPVEIAGIRFVGAAALNYISEIQDQMKITLFDGKGYSCVMNRDGYYIVAPDSASNPNDMPNFFDMIEKRRFSQGYSIEEVREKVKDQEEFTFSTIDSKGRERFISIRPIEDSNWCFINSMDTSVFKEHTNVFIIITMSMVGLTMLLLLGGFWFIHYSRKRLENLYTTAVEGVLNRKYYNEKLKDKHVQSFIMLDIDHLKHINDSSGHFAGDLAISSAAEIIHNRIGSCGDLVIYGGDEFAVVYKQKVSREEFLGHINNILKDMREKKLDKFPDIKLSLSIGGYYGEGVAEELLLLADELLYKAKVARNCAVTNIDGGEDINV